MRRILPAAAAGFFGLCLVSAFTHETGRDGKRARPVQVVTKPPNLDLDFDAEVGKSRKLGDFVRTHMEFVNPQDAPVLGEDGKYCDLRISPARGSVGVRKRRDGSPPMAFVVARIENPNNCKTNKLPLDAGHQAVWIVQFTNIIPIPFRSATFMGKARVVVLGAAGDPTENDRWITTGDGWKLGQCHHDSGDGKTDNATILKHDNVCELTMQFHHNAAQVTAYLKSLPQAAAKARLTVDDDPALWFLCGTDCCYADVKQ
jgi:hypothetical protein